MKGGTVECGNQLFRIACASLRATRRWTVEEGFNPSYQTNALGSVHAVATHEASVLLTLYCSTATKEAENQRWKASFSRDGQNTPLSNWR